MGFFSRLVSGLKNTKKSLGEKLKFIFTGNEIDEDFFEELEFVLISADIGANLAEEVLDKLRDEIKARKIKKTDECKEVLKEIFSLEDLKVDLFNDSLIYEEREALFFYDSLVKINNKYLLNKDMFFVKEKIDLKNKLNKNGKEKIYNILYFKSKILGVNEEEFELLLEILDNKECYNLKMLDISGNDLLNIGIESNKIGKYLNFLLDAVIEEKCKNNKIRLLKYLKNNILK